MTTPAEKQDEHFAKHDEEKKRALQEAYVEYLRAMADEAQEIVDELRSQIAQRRLGFETNTMTLVRAANWIEKLAGLGRKG